MKLFLTTLGVIAAAGLFSVNVRAGSMDLEIHVQPNQTDQSGIQTQGGGSRYHTKEHWLYEVNIENKSFKQMDGLEVRYVIFSTHEKFGSTDPAEQKRTTGSMSVGSLKPHEKRAVKTNAVELDKTQLDGNYYFPTGGKQKAQDSLVGVWVKVFQNGQQLTEYANPSTLLKEHWN